jgi:hypothetical protein
MFWRNILPSFQGRRVRCACKKSGMDVGRGTARIRALSEPMKTQRARWGQQVVPKDWKASTLLHNVTPQMTVIIIVITVRTSNLSIK